MEKYEALEIEVIVFEEKDVITFSNPVKDIETPEIPINNNNNNP